MNQRESDGRITRQAPGPVTGRCDAVPDLDLEGRVAEFLARWPSAGLAVTVVRNGAVDWFLGHGAADIESRLPVTDTVFRVGSLTKTITAVAVMQLVEQGLVDLDAPANQYLRTFQLIPADQRFRPATIRHLLTHTAGIGYWRRLSDLRHPGLGSGDTASSAPALADYYRTGLLVEVEPGTKWAYTNHGFAALGQVVEDVAAHHDHPRHQRPCSRRAARQRAVRRWSWRDPAPQAAS